uniref:Uncharacterized protein n=1 Tax=Clastoptera arizonana TaxID=38151 RepID=A0A1B6C5Y6_9HEMI
MADEYLSDSVSCYSALSLDSGPNEKLIENKSEKYINSEVTNFFSENDNLKLDLNSLCSSSRTENKLSADISLKNNGQRISKTDNIIKLNCKNAVRSRRRSVSYLEQYIKRNNFKALENNSGCDFLTTRSTSECDIDQSEEPLNNEIYLQNSHHQQPIVDNTFIEIVEIPIQNDLQQSLNIITDNFNNLQIERKPRTNLMDNIDVSDEYFMKDRICKVSINNKLEMLTRRKEYSSAVRQINHKKLSTNQQLKINSNKVNTRSKEKINIDKDNTSNNSKNHFVSKVSLGKRKEFSEKVRKKNRENHLRQKEIVDNTNIGKTQEKIKDIKKQLKSEIKNLNKWDELRVMQRRHEIDKIKTKSILKEYSM